MRLKKYMNQLKNLLATKPLLVLIAAYVLLHIVLFNINVAEWGDSYRILRASLYIDNLSYPADEKRPPLFSALIALFPQQPNPVFWGRVTVFFVGLASFGLFLLLLKKFLQSQNESSLAATYFGGFSFMFNPVILYWSLRVMSDVLFLFLVLASFCVYYLIKHPTKKAILLGLLSALAVLTRFEGYLLLFGFGVDYGIAFIKKKNLKDILVLLISFAVMYIPFFIWRNPFTTSYLSETKDHVYDMNTLIIFLTAFLFSLGFTSAAAFFKVPNDFISKNVALIVFLFASFILVLLWPAAVPRILMPILPFLILFVVLELSNKSNEHVGMKDPRTAITSVILLAIYIVSQLKYGQQFLIVSKYLFVPVVLVSIIGVWFLYIRKMKYFYASVIVSAILWSSAVIILHKDMYTTVVEASDYMIKNIKGNVLHNDTTAVLSWNIDYRYPNDGITGDFSPLYNNNMINYNRLIKQKKYDYLIVTNEEKPFFTFKPRSKYLTEVFSSQKFTNGALYKTSIFKINYE